MLILTIVNIAEILFNSLLADFIIFTPPAKTNNSQNIEGNIIPFNITFL
jgi:hypothetical protein